MKPYLVTPSPRPTWGWARPESTRRQREHEKRKALKRRAWRVLGWVGLIAFWAAVLAIVGLAAGLPL